MTSSSANGRPPFLTDAPQRAQIRQWETGQHIGHSVAILVIVHQTHFAENICGVIDVVNEDIGGTASFFLCEIPPNQDVHLFAKIKQTNQKKKTNKKQTDLIADGGRRKLADGAAAERFAFALRRKEAQFFFLVLGQRRTVAHLFRNKN